MARITLAFPNPSRSFNKERNTVHFVGYDGLIQVLFCVEAPALSISGNPAVSEAECLKAFDILRSSILDVAQKVYSRGKNKLYTLTAADF